MSNDDLNDLGPMAENPLEGDLFGDMPPAGESPLGDSPLGDSPLAAAPSAAGDSWIEEEAAIGVAAPLVDDMAATTAAVAAPKVRAPGLLSRLARSNPYTVMLFASLAALLIGIVCLLLVWGSYGFDTKAKGAGGQAAWSVTPAVSASETA